MTEFNFPWSGETLGKAGPYSAALFAQYSEDLLAINGQANSGIIIGRGNGVDAPLDVQETSPASKSVRVRAGSAFVNGRWYYTDADVNVLISDNTDGSGFDRIDLLVLRSNSTTQVITPTIITGTPAGSPTAPLPVRSGAIYDIELAEVTAQNLFTTIVNADIDTSVQLIAPLWEETQGGTGRNTYADGDILAADAADSLGVIPTLATNGAVLVRDSTQSPKYAWIDKRITRIYKSSNSSFEALANPIPIDGEDDLASNLRAVVSASRFYPNAGTYKIWGWTLIQNFSAATENYLFLYDTNAAANVTDIDGELVRSVVRDTFVSAAMFHWAFFEQWVTFAGTENIEIRPVTTTNYRYGNETTPYRPMVLFMEKQFEWAVQFRKFIFYRRTFLAMMVRSGH
jgi:hypothetical protein